MHRVLQQGRKCVALLSIFAQDVTPELRRIRLSSDKWRARSMPFSSTSVRDDFQDHSLPSSRASPAGSTCWKCQHPISSPTFPITCPECHTLQKFSRETIPDYFTLLGQSPNSYQVDLGSLSSNMKKIQQVLHPDRFGNKSEEEQGVSQSLSSFVNEAISTLQNPIERGLYLLKLRGIEIDLEKQLTLDTEFLGEVMELNEKLEEISNSQDWIDFRTANERELEVLETKLTKAFERDNTKEAQLILSQMKYFENLQLKLKEIQSKFNVVD